MRAWMEQHLPELRQKYLSGQRLLYQSLGLGVVVGLAAHIGGYVLMASAPRGLLGLVADLLKSLGLSLWTGVVVVLFVQVIPDAKRRQISRFLDGFDALPPEKIPQGEQAEPKQG
ncbi:MAG TPA: hypothetical protein VLV45_11815 [Gemmatimonadales bacterium]|nr:hypothetical protein [Gemmatimonadales bacterium]